MTSRSKPPATLVTDLTAEKVNELSALVNMLPSSLEGEEVVVYVLLFLDAFAPDPALKSAFLTEIVNRFNFAQIADIMEQKL